MPTPFAKPMEPPARVEVTGPPDEKDITRIALFPPSDTYRLPAESTATPFGLLNVANVPAPFEKPAKPFPATVVTEVLGKIKRMAWLPVSAMYTLPVRGSTAAPPGCAKHAARPTPSQKAIFPPASVFTDALGYTIRI